VRETSLDDGIHKAEDADWQAGFCCVAAWIRLYVQLLSLWAILG
jgi:hypothetical protein